MERNQQVPPEKAKVGEQSGETALGQSLLWSVEGGLMLLPLEVKWKYKQGRDRNKN